MLSILSLSIYEKFSKTYIRNEQNFAIQMSSRKNVHYHRHLSNFKMFISSFVTIVLFVLFFIHSEDQ